MTAISGIAILGATGTIGRNALDILRRHPERFRAVLLTAHRDYRQLAQLCQEFQPDVACIGDAVWAEAQAYFQSLGLSTRLIHEENELCAALAAADIDQVVAGIVGAAGLLPTLAAVRAGKRILLANKEPLVMAGGLFMAAAEQSGALLLPLDSEHNAAFQCLPAGSRCGVAPKGIRSLWLTASGGPFRETPVTELAAVSVADAIRHPNWVMGPKISVDSATMMNKGLEVIEATWLFNLPVDSIKVVLHPQSTIHALVEYLDGSWLAQLGQPDMRTPIAHALAWPDRIESGVAALDLLTLARLDFRSLDHARYPCFPLAMSAARQGGLAPTVLNAANEVAVADFLAGRLAYLAIATRIEAALNAFHHSEFVTADATELTAILACDAWARSLPLRAV